MMVGFREIGKTELLQELVFPDGNGKGDDLSCQQGIHFCTQD
jgi:hypothetical protein